MAAKTAKKVGRPSKYSQEVAESICARIAAGESLRSICEAAELPHKDTVLQWLADRDDFAAKYARAREAQAEHHHDEMDRLEAAVEGGTLNPQAGSVILANKRWRMEKLKPKVYGHAVTVRGDAENPIQTRSALTDAELEALAAAGLPRG